MAPSDFTRTLLQHDPNGIVDLEVHGCRTPNDYVDWETLSSKVKTKTLSPEEMKGYIEGTYRLEEW